MKLDFIKGTYTINADGSYDVIGDVDLYNKGLSKLPIRFNKVSGYFDCSYNNLILLEFCPKEVDGDFYCSRNKLTSLEGCPTSVGGHFYCINNQLTSLEFSPKEVGGSFICYNNKLTTLEGSPKEVGSDFSCYSNNLYNFIGIGRIEGSISCFDNPVSEIYKLYPTLKFIGYLNEFTPIRGKTILGKRLQDCLYMCDKELDVTKLTFENYTLLE